MSLKADGIQHLLELPSPVMGLGVDHGLFMDPARPQRDMSIHLERNPELLKADLRNTHEQAASVPGDL